MKFLEFKENPRNSGIINYDIMSNSLFLIPVIKQAHLLVLYNVE